MTFRSFTACALHALLLIAIGCASKKQPEEPVSVSKDPSSEEEVSSAQRSDSMTEPMTKKFYKTYTLDNGLQVYLIEKRDIPMVTILVAVKNGAFAETMDNNGLAHLYEHMFFKANEKIPSQPAFMDELADMGIELGPNMNALTSTESVRYYFTIQKLYLERGLNFMADALRTPKFVQEELEKERKVVIGEFDRYEASPLQVFFQQDILKKMFSDHFTRKNTIGIRDVILSASREQMHEIQHRYYIPNNSAIFIVGDFEEELTRATIQEAFGTWEKGPDPFEAYPVPEHPPLQKTENFTKEAPIKTAHMVQAYHGPKLTLNDKHLIAFDLMSIILGLESNIFQKELVDSGIANSASVYVWDQRYTSPVLFSIETTPEKSEMAKKSFKNLIEQMAKGGFFQQKELDMAKTALEVSSAYDRESGQRFALSLASIWTSTGDIAFYEDYLNTMKAITLEDLDEALALYVKDKPYIFGELVPAKEQPNPEATPKAANEN